MPPNSSARAPSVGDLGGNGRTGDLANRNVPGGGSGSIIIRPPGVKSTSIGHGPHADPSLRKSRPEPPSTQPSQRTHPHSASYGALAPSLYCNTQRDARPHPANPDDPARHAPDRNAAQEQQCHLRVEPARAIDACHTTTHVSSLQRTAYPSTMHPTTPPHPSLPNTAEPSSPTPPLNLTQHSSPN
jgi:hypothetical protein